MRDTMKRLSTTQRQIAAMNEAARIKAARLAAEAKEAERLADLDEKLVDRRSASEIQIARLFPNRDIT